MSATQSNNAVTITLPETLLDSEALLITDEAAAKISELMLEEGNPHLRLRIYITGGGCSGFQYNFAFEETLNIEYVQDVDGVGDDALYNKNPLPS